MKTKTLVDAYIACGRKIGFFHAEMILMRHLPDDNPGGVCSDVPQQNRQQCLQELQEATNKGVEHE